MAMYRLLALLSIALLLAACGGTTASETPPAPATAPATSSVATQVATLEATVPPAATATTTAPPATTSPTAPAAPSGDAKAAVLAASKAQMTSGPFRSETTIVSQGKTTEIVGEFVPPSALRVIMKSEDIQNESVIVGEQMWIKTGEQWTLLPNSGPQIANTLAEFAQDPEARGIVINNAEYIGPDILDGTPTWVYSYDTVFGEGDQAVQAQTKLWIGATDGLPRKQESVGTFNGVETTSSALITYDPTITIEPPTQ